jgi:cytochrome c peroxidase
MKSKLIATLGALMIFGVLASCSAFAADSPDLIALGKAIFFDKNLSQPNGQACASCHNPYTGFAHPNREFPTSQGVVDICFGNRNAPSAAYAAYSPPLHWDPTPLIGNMMQGMYVGGLFWDGRVDTLEEQATKPFLNLLEMHNHNPAMVVQAIRKSDYAKLFLQIFGPRSLKNVATAFQQTGEAIAAYERSSEVNPFTSKFDSYADGLVQLSEPEARGLALFQGKANCVKCHSMDNPDPVAFPGLKPLFTNFGYQNIGAPKNPDNPFYNLPKKLNPAGKNYVDLGLGELLAANGDPNAAIPNATALKQNGKFKIPSLRNCAVTPPYEHNGVFRTLKEVVMFNNTRDVMGAGWPPPEVPENVHRHMPMEPGFFGMIGLNNQEVDDIVAFLETLTDGYKIQ